MMLREGDEDDSARSGRGQPWPARPGTKEREQLLQSLSDLSAGAGAGAGAAATGAAVGAGVSAPALVVSDQNTPRDGAVSPASAGPGSEVVHPCMLVVDVLPAEQG